MASVDTLFTSRLRVNDLDRAREFYGGLLGCPKAGSSGRADFNFFGHHIVAHMNANEVVGEEERQAPRAKGAARRCVISGRRSLEKFEEIERRLKRPASTSSSSRRDTPGRDRPEQN